MLKVENVNVFYGNVHALRDVSIEVNKGEIVTLIGANGAGKTSILRAISNLENVKSGKVYYKEKDITNIGAHNIVHQRLIHIPEGRRIFGELTVEENLMMGAYSRKNLPEARVDKEMIYDMFERLKERKAQIAGTLSGGEQQMLAIGRALMSDPQLLLMDEPSMGLAPIVVDQIFDIIQKINKRGTTILLVEQNANMALSIADRGYVLETGQITLEGKASELINDDQVKKAYLGE
ncbi:MAG: ABC transporter ATP-binding protein [Lachnospiraceae bacterium]|nr:ABC transporter ATP-binding protein [Lachnospiraceae bacterium]